MSDFHAYTNTANTGSVSLDDVREAMAKGLEIRKKYLRKQGELIKRTECKVCKRKPTFVNRGHGDVMLVCPHIWETLSVLPRQPAAPDTLFHGLQIELFDDGPRRW